MAHTVCPQQSTSVPKSGILSKQHLHYAYIYTPVIFKIKANLYAVFYYSVPKCIQIEAQPFPLNSNTEQHSSSPLEVEFSF